MVNPDEQMSLNILLSKWNLRVKRFQLAHRFAAKGLGKFHLLIGISAVALATTTGTAMFASVEQSLPGYGKILTGILSLLGALLTALQTFLRLDEKSDKHQRADANYSAILQKIEQFQAIGRMTSEKSETLEEFLDIVRREIDQLTKDSPIAPERYWQKARAIIAKERSKGNLAL